MSKLLVLAIVFATSIAHADPEDEPKSPVVAEALTVAGTAAGPLMFAGALKYEDGPGKNPVPLLVASGAAAAFGPTLGDWYAGKTWSRGTTYRLLGGGAFALGASIVVSSLWSGNDATGLVGIGIAGVGAAGVIGGTALDLWDAPHAAVAYNRAHARRQLAVAPLVSRDRSGLAVVGTF